MDTTQKYIEMCREAKEIQKRWCPFSSHAVVGDIYAELSPNTTECKTQTYTRATSGLCIWLPRQDQLQNMLSDSTREILFYNQIILDCWDSNSDKHMTMEQLWLWLVMDKKYGKRWNPEQKRWIKC